jgi:hypothetical protein
MFTGTQPALVNMFILRSPLFLLDIVMGTTGLPDTSLHHHSCTGRKPFGGWHLYTIQL